jgi:hypothetical protein
MKPTVCTALLLASLFSLCQYTYGNLQVNFLETAATSKAYTYDNLRLYPVFSKETFKATFRTVGKYMPLQEALQKKKVKVTGKGSDGSVNSLSIENVSSDTIIIICSDVVKGGRQGRIIQKDMVLGPKSDKKDLWRKKSVPDQTNNKDFFFYSGNIQAIPWCFCAGVFICLIFLTSER